MAATARARITIDDSLIGDEAHGDDADDLSAWRREVRLRALARSSATPPKPLRVQRWAWLLAIVVHLIVIVALRVMLRDSHEAIADRDVIRVDLIDAPTPEPALPRPEAPPTSHAAPAGRRTTHARAVTRVPPAAAPAAIEETPSIHLFNRDGSASVPDDLAAQIDRARPVPNFIPLKVEPSPLLQDKRPLKVRPNHFAQYWNGPDGMPLHQTIWRYVTATKEFTAPWGGRYGCTWVLILIACADIPDKPWSPPQTWKPATELDER